ncbi:MAG: hypothetical protein MUE42_10545 [Opitutaceae bacterium]|jgi:hypothetical protein|nr:hypothetical protein [Opitutaceae bacterium]
MSRLSFYALLACLCVLGPFTLRAHDHIEAGVDPEDESRLGLAGPGFQLSLYVPRGEPLSTYLPQFPGGFYATELSFSAEGNVIEFPPGARTRIELVSVTGPQGASFGFWETGATTPTFTRPVGWTASEGDRPSFPVYENASGYGHIHGRAFTADHPGDYQIVFRAVDESATYAPSQPKTVLFRALSAPQLAIRIESGDARLTFSSRPNLSYDLQASTTLTDDGWQTIAFADGTGAVIELADPLAGRPQVFYRLVEYR